MFKSNYFIFSCMYRVWEVKHESSIQVRWNDGHNKQTIWNKIKNIKIPKQRQDYPSIRPAFFPNFTCFQGINITHTCSILVIDRFENVIYLKQKELFNDR